MKYIILGLLGLFTMGCMSIDKRSCCKKGAKVDKEMKQEKGQFCRIGMSTQLKKRIEYWEKRCKKKGVEILDWEVLNCFDSKKEAQEYETRQAAEQKCIAHPGGRPPKKEGKWILYRLDMTGSC